MNSFCFMMVTLAANYMSTASGLRFLKYQLGNDWTTGDLRPKSAISHEVSAHEHHYNLKFRGQSNEDKNAYFNFFNATYYKSNGVILE
jgi:hypothetical protein